MTLESQPLIDTDLIWWQIEEDLQISAVSDGWESLAERIDLRWLRRTDVVGQQLLAFLAAERHDAWRRWLAALFAGQFEPPPKDLSPDAVAVWPARQEGRRVLFLILRPAMEQVLEAPLVLVGARTGLEAINGNAAELLAELQLPSRQAMMDWLDEHRPEPPRRLRRLGAWRVDDRVVERLEPIAPFGNSGFYLLARVLRAGMHDLSNPLSAVRMWIEISRMRSGIGDDPLESVGGLIGQLDEVGETLSAMRRIAHADRGDKPFRVEDVLNQCLGLLRSELQRREIEVDIFALGEPKLNGCSNPLALLTLSGLLTTMGRSARKDRLQLRWLEDGKEATLELHATDAAHSLLPEVETDREWLGSLAAGLNAEFRIWPGERPHRDPDWSVVITR